MKTGRLLVVVPPRWFLLDASVTIRLDGKAVAECSLKEGAAIGPIEVEAGEHELSALLVGIVRRKTTKSVEVKPGHELAVDVSYSRLTGNLALHVVRDRPLVPVGQG